MTRGGANLMMSPCVGLASSPLSLNFRHTSQASYSIIKTRHLHFTNINTCTSIQFQYKVLYMYLATHIQRSINPEKEILIP